MQNDAKVRMLTLDMSEPVWERFFLVHPLVVVGTKDESGEDNLSPKHMAMPLGWQNDFGCIGSPQHRTYHNSKREAVYTVSYPQPTQIVSDPLQAIDRRRPYESEKRKDRRLYS